MNRFIPYYLILIYLLCIPFTNSAQDTSQYLNENHSEIDINEVTHFKDFDLLQKDVDTYELFLTGENHEVSINSKLAFKFFKYFYENANVRYYMLELPHSFACILNQELQKDSITDYWKNYEIFNLIYHYNKTLADGQKIKFIGIDIERVIWYSIPQLKLLLCKEKNTIASIEKYSKQADSLNTQYEKIMATTQNVDTLNAPLKELSYALFQDLSNLPTEYKEYLGETYFDFNIIVTNLVNNFEAHWGESQQLDNQGEVHKREKSMYETYYKFFPTLKGKVFGQFGSLHVCQDTSGTTRIEDNVMTWKNPYTFAWILNHDKNSPIQGKVLSIGYNYKKCLTSQHNREYHPVGAPCEAILTREQEDLFVKSAKTDFTLFKLNQKKSPLQKLANNFQFILLIQNQKQLISN